MSPATSKDSVKKDTLQEYDFTVKANVVDGPLLKIFVPTLTRLEPININGHFTSANNNWNLTADAPLVLMGANRIQKVHISAGTKGNAIQPKYWD